MQTYIITPAGNLLAYKPNSQIGTMLPHLHYTTHWQALHWLVYHGRTKRQGRAVLRYLLRRGYLRWG